LQYRRRHAACDNPITAATTDALFLGFTVSLHSRLSDAAPFPAFVFAIGRNEAQLCDIDENLARNDLDLLERAEHLCRRKEIYERLHPETRRSGYRGNQHIGGRSRLNFLRRLTQKVKIPRGSTWAARQVAYSK
jgi:hypothetical protein